MSICLSLLLFSCLTSGLGQGSSAFTLGFTASAFLVLRPLEDMCGITSPTLPGLLLAESSILGLNFHNCVNHFLKNFIINTYERECGSVSPENPS